MSVKVTTGISNESHCIVIYCRDIRPQSRGDYGVQIQLRFCLLETSCEQEDNFPPSICVRVNGKMATLPVSIKYRKYVQLNSILEISRLFNYLNLFCRIQFQPTSQVWSQNDLVDRSILRRFVGSRRQCLIISMFLGHQS